MITQAAVGCKRVLGGSFRTTRSDSARVLAIFGRLDFDDGRQYGLYGFAVVTWDVRTIHVPVSRVHTSRTHRPPLKNRAMTTSPRRSFCSRERGT